MKNTTLVTQDRLALLTPVEKKEYYKLMEKNRRFQNTRYLHLSKEESLRLITLLDKMGVEHPVQLKNSNLVLGTRINPKTVRGLEMLNKASSRNTIEYIEVVGEYAAHVLLKIHTTIKVNKHSSSEPSEYYTYTESISKADIASGEAFIEVAE